MRVLVVPEGLIGVLTLLLVGILCISTVSAVMVSSPNVVKPGERVEVYLGNLDAGNNIDVSISGNVIFNAGEATVENQSDYKNSTAGQKFSLIINDFNPDFDCRNVVVDVDMENLVPRTKSYLRIQNSTTGTSDQDIVDMDGKAELHLTGGMDNTLVSDNYKIIIEGTSASSEIPVNMTFSGEVVKSPPLAMPSFDLIGLSNGVFNVEAKINDVVTESKTITVQDSILASNMYS